MKFLTVNPRCPITTNLAPKEAEEAKENTPPPPFASSFIRMLTSDKTSAIDLMFAVDISGSMDGSCGKNFYKDLKDDILVLAKKNPKVNIMIMPFGYSRSGFEEVGGKYIYRNEVKNPKCVFTPEEFAILINTTDKKDLVSPHGTDVYAIVQFLNNWETGNLNLIVIGDGGFEKPNVLIKSMIENFHKLSTMSLHVVGGSSGTTETLTKTFMAGLKDTTASFPVRDFSLESLRAAAEASSTRPNAPEGFSVPVFAGVDWLSLRKEMIPAKPEELTRSLNGVGTEEMERLVGGMLYILASIDANQVTRLADGDFPSIWKIAKVMKNMSSGDEAKKTALKKEIDRISGIASRIPSLQEMIADSKKTEYQQDFLKSLVAAIGGKYIVPTVAIGLDGKMPSFPPKSAEVGEMLGRFLGATVGPPIDPAIDGDFERVPMLTKEEIGLLLPNVQSAFVDYISLLVSGVLGVMNERLNGFLLLRLVLHLMSGPFRRGGSPIAEIFTQYLAGNHRVFWLKTADGLGKASDEILNYLGEASTFALLSWGVHEFPSLASEEFKTFLLMIQQGRAFASVVKSGGIMNHQSSSWRTDLIEHQRVLDFLACLELIEIWKKFQFEAHRVDLPPTGGGIRKWLSDGLRPEDKEVFDFFLSVLGGETKEALRVTDAAALSSTMCSFCCMSTTSIHQHVADMADLVALSDPTTRKWDPKLHSGSQLKLTCPACGCIFSSPEERNAHMQSSSEFCTRGQLIADRALHLRVVNDFVAALKTLMSEESMTLSHILRFKAATPKAKMEALLLEPQVQDFLGKSVISTLAFGAHVTPIEIARNARTVDAGGVILIPNREVLATIDPGYLKEVLAAIPERVRQETDARIADLHKITQCFVCFSDLAGCEPQACGHVICNTCFNGVCKASIGRSPNGIKYLLSMPRCWCGYKYPLESTAPRCRDLAKVARFSDEGNRILKCTGCRVWWPFPHGDCVAANDEVPPLPIHCGKCAAKVVRPIIAVIEMPESHRVSRNPLFPSTCKSCGLGYIHDANGYSGCSHTTCSCGHEQCKVCGMVFFANGVRQNPTHYSFPVETEVDGETVHWYPERCHHHDDDDDVEEHDDWY